MTKTPDEIKKGLECCNTNNSCNKCPYYGEDWCSVNRNNDTLAYIQQLEADNAQLNRCIENMTDKLNALNDEVAKLQDHLREATKKVEQLQAERDAAVRDMTEIVLQSGEVYCDYCVADFKPNCKGRCWTHNEGFKWRGVQKEE